MIDLHYVATANGVKVAIALAELEIPHRVIQYDLFGGQHLSSGFRAINPNNKLPAIVDHDPMGGGAPLPVFESGAILLYLAEKTGRLMPSCPRQKSVMQQWLFWQMAGLGPMHGQAHHFVRYAPVKVPYAINRYSNEARRLLNVLDFRLSQSGFMAGDDYSVADIAAWPWVSGAGLIGIDIDEFPSVEKWCAAIECRAAVKEVMGRQETSVPQAYVQTSPVLDPEQWSNTFGENMLSAASSHRSAELAGDNG